MFGQTDLPLFFSIISQLTHCQGYIVSDWGAQHTTKGSANGGMDMAMPGDGMGDGQFLWGANLTSAVERFVRLKEKGRYDGTNTDAAEPYLRTDWTIWCREFWHHGIYWGKIVTTQR